MSNDQRTTVVNMPRQTGKSTIMREMEDASRLHDIEALRRRFAAYAENPLPTVLAIVLTDKHVPADTLARIEAALRIPHLPSQYHRIANAFCNEMVTRRG